MLVYCVVNSPALGDPESDLEEFQRTHSWHFQFILIITVSYHNASAVPCTPISLICFSPLPVEGLLAPSPPCLLLPHQLQVLLWSRVKIHWSAQRPPGKGRDPKNYSEYIFLLSLHEQQDGAREICHETVLNVLGGRTCSPHGLSAQ